MDGGQPGPVRPSPATATDPCNNVALATGSTSYAGSATDRIEQYRNLEAPLQLLRKPNEAR